jgi:spermidine synthase
MNETDTSRRIVYQKKTEDGYIRIRHEKWEGEDALILFVNGSAESGMYADPKKSSDFLFPYMEKFSYAPAVRMNLQNTYLIGGGGFAYAKYYLNRYPGKRITAAEYSEPIIRLARRYFDLNKLERNPDFHLVAGDGLVWLSESNEMFDLIINDAFEGHDAQGRDMETVQMIHSHLSPEGIYMVNVISAANGPMAMEKRRMHRLLASVFPYVKMIRTAEDCSPLSKENLVFAASDAELL